MPRQSKILTIVGWLITALVGAGLSASAAMKFANPPDMAKEWVEHLGYPLDRLQAIAIAEITCVVIYIFPRTAVLGAILLTGYLGGAVATHVRVHDNFAGPAIGGVLVWLGLFLREPRLRALLPLRQTIDPVEPKL